MYGAKRMMDITLTHETRADATDLASVPESRIHRILPQAMVGIGLGLTVAWTCLLGYGFIILVWATIWRAALDSKIL
jgi:hypothetical protein